MKEIAGDFIQIGLSQDIIEILPYSFFDCLAGAGQGVYRSFFLIRQYDHPVGILHHILKGGGGEFGSLKVNNNDIKLCLLDKPDQRPGKITLLNKSLRFRDRLPCFRTAEILQIIASRFQQGMVNVTHRVLIVLVGGDYGEKEGGGIQAGGQFHRPGISPVKILLKRKGK